MSVRHTDRCEVAPRGHQLQETLVEETAQSQVDADGSSIMTDPLIVALCWLAFAIAVLWLGRQK